MNVKEFLKEFIIVFPITFVVAAVVSHLYSLIAHGTGVVDWEYALRMTIILSVVLPTIHVIGKGKK